MSLSRIRLLMWKEFLQLKRDRLLLPLLLILPLLYLVMFGYVVGVDVNNIPTAIVDQDRTPASRALGEAFTTSSFFEVIEYPPDEQSVQPLMDGNRIQAALVIPPGFERSLERGDRAAITIIVDGTDSKTASVASSYTQQIVLDVNQTMLKDMGLSLDVPGIDSQVRALYNPSLRNVNSMIPALGAFIFMMIIMAIMGQAVVRERERGTLEQMFVTPITRTEYLIGKIAPYLILASIQVTFVLVLGALWFNVPFYGDILVIGVGLLLFAFSAIGFGLAISMISKNRQQAQQTLMFILLPTMVLSGFIFPIESMPAPVVPLTYLIPLRYIIIVLRDNWMKGAGFDVLWPEMLALAGFSVVFFVLALARFRKRLTD